MSDIDFQNGFICGMATRGLTRSGEYYKPNIWNDDGVFNYFYIDFKSPLNDFSLGMFLESIIVYDSEQVNITDVELISSGIYKVYANLEDKINGVTVINKKSTLLTFQSGRTVPVFSTMFYVKGIASYTRKAYVYEKVGIFDSDVQIAFITDETINIRFFANFDGNIIDEEVVLEQYSFTVNESVDVSFWGS